MSCADCMSKTLCMAKAIDRSDIDQFENLVRHPRPASKGVHIYRQGSKFRSVYVVRSGAVKTYSIDNDGSEQINGFYLPGDLIGVDGLGSNNHVNNAIALVTTSVCEIPFSTLEAYLAGNNSLRRHFMSLMSREIIKEQRLMMMLAQKNADERFAHFLLDLSSSFQLRKQSAEAFVLPMSRSNIASYLGLANETLSRLVTRFETMGWITANNRSVVITDKSALIRLVEQQKAAAA